MKTRPKSRKIIILKMAIKISFHAAYGGIALFISLLNNIFLLYYVDTFVNVYKIDRKSFWIGEVRCRRGMLLNLQILVTLSFSCGPKQKFYLEEACIRQSTLSVSPLVIS